VTFPEAAQLARLRREIDDFVRRHGLAEAWERWQEERLGESHEPTPPGGGIDFAPDARERRKGDRRRGERRAG
jgi:hypothetical protein